VEITYLLRRAHLAQADRVGAAEYVRGATVLITGAGGSIGRELARQVAYAAPHRLLLLGHGENSIFDTENIIRQDFPGASVRSIIADIRDEGRIESVFAEYAPQVVFHAAAHKHLPLMEENPIEAVSNNIVGTYIVASAALRHRTQRFVLISTDKAVSPTSIMGATKRVAEMVVRRVAANASTAFVVVRFGNVLGSRGSVVPIFKAQIEAGGPITLTHPDVRRFFMTIPEAVNLVLRAGGFEGGSASYVLDMGTPVLIRDLAEDLIRLSGYSVDEIPIVFIGLRPGEKLEELLWEEPGRVEPTPQAGILKVSGEHDQLAGSLDQVMTTFRDLAANGKRIDIEAALASQVASFVPSTFAPSQIDATPSTWAP
jgi:FlaA1/EpsC-like NDP-sugar epimerase